MRTRKFNALVRVLSLTGSPATVVMSEKVWCNMAPLGSLGRQNGLRLGVVTDITTRPKPAVFPGQFLQREDQLWVVESVTSDRQSGYISAVELVGQEAIYASATGTPYTLRAFLQTQAPAVGDFEISAHQRRIQVAKLELKGERERGDTITLGGVVWRVTGQPDGGDDGAVITLVIEL